jgi:hypothetical protein
MGRAHNENHCRLKELNEGLLVPSTSQKNAAPNRADVEGFLKTLQDFVNAKDREMVFAHPEIKHSLQTIHQRKYVGVPNVLVEVGSNNLTTN